MEAATGQTRADARRLLAIYINDHRGAAAAGIALARRAQGKNAGTSLGDELQTIVEDLHGDAATLESIAARLAVAPNRVKRHLARGAELVSRLKPYGRFREYSPLSRLLELEALRAGIDAKRSLWLALRAAVSQELPEIDFEMLVGRATDQRRRLEPYHRAAAEEALSAERATHERMS